MLEGDRQIHQESIEQAETLAGATIITAEYNDPREDEEWGDHGEFKLTLQDGRVVTFWSTGHDASQVFISIDPPPQGGRSV